MNRIELRQLAEDRILDAAALLAVGRWSGAYFLPGYAVECGLKSCVLAFVDNTGAIFQDKKYAEKCWTHDLESLVFLANLQPTLDIEMVRNPILSANWRLAKDWRETSRYEQKTEFQARALYDAITNDPNGMLSWIRSRW